MRTKMRLTVATVFMAGAVMMQPSKAQSGYVAGDFHQHTTYTDGSYTMGKMMEMNNKYGLDWWANSEHGGGFATWGLVTGIDLGTSVKWSAAGITKLGKANGENMWRWQSIRDWSYRDVQLWRKVYPQKLILQGYEMNVPGHEHASTCIIANQFDSLNVNPIARFEYMFDNSDKDDTNPNGWVKSTKTGHEKAVEAMSWLQNNYPKTSWVVPAHPERYKYNGSTGWNINHLRDMNNAAPDVFFGFESIPGHQKSTNRGEYASTRPSYGTETYGGAGWMSAKVGGLWDAMLSEGRHFWIFANSDCHNNESTGGDFFPGEYQKTYTYVTKKQDAQAIADGLRSGNSYCVMGDLIDSLTFTAGTATMGATYKTAENQVTLKIRLRDPQGNNYNRYSTYTNPAVDHVDVIVGEYGSKIDPTNTAAYATDTVKTTKIAARFAQTAGYTDGAGITTQAWSDAGNGWKEITFNYTILAGKKLYFRLRGSNLGINIAGETDNLGNPLIDTEGTNSAAKAFEDLWFYSNPVFVENTNPISAISKTEATDAIVLTPNPAKGSVKIKLAEPQQGLITLTDMSGKTVRTIALNNEQEKAIELRGLSKGIYQVSTNNGQSRKLIVE